ncbi:LysM peptidoglycan-binding domain-containing protein [Alloprevotella sp. OH1205_COT-284]|nr:LysM peptidoglycan-binding domain-containing protein [Alloprevotella sp. OH1205_COT-284]
MVCRFFSLFVFFWSCLVLSAQQDAYRQYIDTYKTMAVDQMMRYRIPASIKLAQGLLESNAGRSTLATMANNHFGIKTGGGWNGPYVLRDDDAPNERFRKYKNPAESFEDHSLFLSKRGRYSNLFHLHPHDYKGWAYGLKAAGYATNPQYAEILIGIIERYGLHEFDRVKYSRLSHGRQAEAMGRRLYLCNDLVYLIAEKGDSFSSLAKDFKIREKRLRKYNEVDKYYELAEGDVVYLKKKKRHVAKAIRNTLHTIQPGESMYGIAQRYGIRLAYLYKWNLLPEDYTATSGDRLLLR